MRTQLTVALALFALAVPARADELELIGDRPDFTESNATVAAGHLQLEGGVEAGAAGDGISLAMPKLLARFGVHRSLELRLEVPDLVITIPDEGDRKVAPGALAAGIKWVHPLGSKAAAGFIAMLGSPVRRGDFDATGMGATLNGLWGVDLTERLALGGNVRFDLDGLGAVEGVDLTSTFTASVSLGIGLTEALGIFVETFHSINDRGNYTPNADAGLTFLVTPRFQLDLYGGADLSGAKDGWFSGVGAIALF